MSIPLLVDCDTGIDDAIALTYLAAHPGAEIAGIVSTGGNVEVGRCIATAWCNELLGVDAPIARGAERPLVQEPMFADDTHGPGGLGHAVLPDPTRTGDARTGAQLWVDLARQRPGELVGLVLGPHTNLALALEIEPELPRLLRRLSWAGRSTTAATPGGERWNIAVDPEAAQRVLTAFSGRAAPVLGSLEATSPSVSQAADRFAALVESTGHPVAQILVDALRFYFEFHEADGFGWTAHVHDPLVTAHAVTGDFAGTRPLAVDVELAGTLTRGQTVGDELGRWGREPNLEVLTDVRPGEFIEHLLATLERAVRDPVR